MPCLLPCFPSSPSPSPASSTNLLEAQRDLRLLPPKKLQETAWGAGKPERAGQKDPMVLSRGSARACPSAGRGVGGVGRPPLSILCAESLRADTEPVQGFCQLQKSVVMETKPTN